MSDPFENPIHDLFDFPEVDGLEEFGLVPPIPASMRAEQEAAEAMANEANADDPTAVEAEVASGEGDGPVAAARPNPPVPEGIEDLDEDLFQFDELFSLDDDPYQNGTLGADGQPLDTSFMDPAPVDEEPEAAEVVPEPIAAAPVEEPAPVAQEAAPAPAPQAAPQPQAQQPAPAAPLPSSFPPLPDDGVQGQGLRDRGPRILLPEDVPYSIGGENQRMLWALIACFLVLCSGMFYVTYQSSKAFQATLLANTDRLADAIDRSQHNAPALAPPATAAPTSASVPVDPSLTYSIDLPGSLPRGADLPKRSQSDRWIDPRNYANTHEFAVGNAKAMLSNGQFEEARRLLNHVLANQARIPLSPTLREEIDYLIPLTYFEHGNATAPVQGEDR